jgi:hypothetical protein
MKIVKNWNDFLNEGLFDLFGKDKAKEQQEQQEKSKKEQLTRMKDKIEIVFPGYTEGLDDLSISKLFIIVNTICFWDGNMSARSTLTNFFEKLNDVLVQMEKGIEPKEIKEISELDERCLYWFIKLLELMKNGYYLDKQGNKNVIKTFTSGGYYLSIEKLSKFFNAKANSGSNSNPYHRTAVMCIEKLSKLGGAMKDPYKTIERIWTYRKS